MQRIYLDNASTSFPKPREVADAVYEYMTQAGSNIGRGGYASAYATENAVFAARQLLCDFFGGDDLKNVVFMKNVTEALNVLIRGFLHSGEHVLVSSLEHNAVMRSLQELGRELLPDEDDDTENLSFTRIPCDERGELRLDALPRLLRRNTRAVLLTHVSNVCGTVQPLREVGEFCERHGLRFIVDSAQGAGLLPIDMRELRIDALAFTGHKGLLGPQGVGGFVLRESMVEQVEPLLFGGTGSMSHTERMPAFMPDKFEAGTLNLPGIIGLAAGVRWLREQGLQAVLEHELELTRRFIEGVEELREEVRIVGHRDCVNRTGVVSLDILHQDCARVAQALSERYGIATRVGLHCAPNAHKALGTYPRGTLRFSFGWHNTLEEIEQAVRALQEVLNNGV